MEEFQCLVAIYFNMHLHWLENLLTTGWQSNSVENTGTHHSLPCFPPLSIPPPIPSSEP